MIKSTDTPKQKESEKWNQKDNHYIDFLIMNVQLFASN